MFTNPNKYGNGLTHSHR